MEVEKVVIIHILFGSWESESDLTGQFVFEISERHLWPSDFGKQRPQLLQCSYFSLPPTLVDTFVGEKKHGDKVNILKQQIHYVFIFVQKQAQKTISSR